MFNKLLLPIEKQLDKLLFWLQKGQAITSGTQFQTNLKVKHFRGTELLQAKDLGAGLVTNAAVFLWAADWNNATATIKLANWHDSGTGTTAPTVSDTIMQTSIGSARTQGSQSNVNNIYQTVANVSYGNTYAITEWGLLTDQTIGTLFDHRTFTAINVVAGDTIQFTYALTVVAGG